MVHDLSVILEKTRKIETLALLCPKDFLAVAVREKLALIQVAAKVCLFSGLGSICLWNLIGEKFIFDPGIPPGEFFKNICSPRRIADTEGLYHFNMGSYLKNYTTVSISNPCEVATSIMILWKDGPGNCN